MTFGRDPLRITVLGAGFGALSTVRELRRRDHAARITLVAPRAELHDLPGIIWIPSGLRTGADLVVPLDNFLRRMGVDFHVAEVNGLADRERTGHTTPGDVANDALVIATGGRCIKKLPGIEHAFTAAELIRERLRDMRAAPSPVGFAGNPNEPNAVLGGSKGAKHLANPLRNLVKIRSRPVNGWLKYGSATLLAATSALLLSLAAEAAPLSAAGDMPALSLNDQHDKPAQIGPATRWVVFTAEKPVSDMVSAVLAAEPAGVAERLALVFIADISGMPALVTRMFALPKLRELSFPIALVREPAGLLTTD